MALQVAYRGVNTPAPTGGVLVEDLVSAGGSRLLLHKGLPSDLRTLSAGSG